MTKLSCISCFVVLLLLASPTRAAAARAVHVVVEKGIEPPAAHALRQLTMALERKDFKIVRQATLPKRSDMAFVVGLPKDSASLRKLMDRYSLTLPEAAESLLVKKLLDRSPPVVLIAGHDQRGLMYALLDLARSIELAPTGADPLAEIQEAHESPLLAVRAVTIHLFNADVDGEWYDDEAFWRRYFTMLARCRFNTFALTFADHTAHLNPPYPFLVKVPEYPQVKAIGLSEAERERNLQMLRRISELSSEHGIDFVFSTWMQGARLLDYLGKNRVEGLPEYPKDYSAKALGLILRACPEIRGVQFRMNLESGIPEDKQADFYKALFEAIRDCGGPVKLDLRFKGLRPETIREAVAAGVDVNVSTKYWCEQMGLPYHPTVEDKVYRHGRYGYADMLHYPRPYKVTYRLWTVGTQKILLWGDPEFGARFARSCLLGGGRGFEVFAPLTNKGYGNAPGKWRIFADASYEHYRYEQERYWMFYLAFGRTGYNPDVNPHVWMREFRHRFGKAAPHVESAYRTASKILPLITAVRLNSASEWRTWPEMEPLYGLQAYARLLPSDTAQFYPIRTFKRVPGYRSEGWAGGIQGYVEAVTQGTLRAKRTPFDVSRRLDELSKRTLAAVEQACRLAADPQASEFKGAMLDMRILAHIAAYHAEKTLAATHVELFKETKEAGRLPVALEHITKAIGAWDKIVELTEGVYYDKMVFGFQAPDSLKPPFTKTSKIVHHLRGHWKDRLAMVRADLATVKDLVAKHGGHGQRFRKMPGEMPLADPPTIKHEPITSAKPGEDLKIVADVASSKPIEKVVLHHRPVNQRVDWRQVDMKPTGDGRFAATIPADVISPHFDYMYYVEALVEGGGGTLWPRWEEGPPYVVVELDRTIPTSDARVRKPLATVAPDGPTAVEAEDGYLTAVWPHTWELKTDLPGFSGRGFLRALPDRGDRIAGRPADNCPCIEIPLTFEQPGTYRLWVRMRGPKSGNSVFAGLNGKELSPGNILHVPAETGWQWVGRYEKGPSVLVEVGRTGTHTINLWMREDGVAVDRVLVTRQFDFIPRD